MTTSSTLTARCDGCGAEIAGGLLACPGCARLVHRAELSRIAREAEEAEKNGDLTAALGAWRRAIELLPPRTVQRTTIETRMQGLSAELDGRGKPGAKGGAKAKAVAGVGAAGALLLKSKALLALFLTNGKLLLLGLTKLPTVLSMLLYMQWSGGRGAAFGIGLVASIYVHEVGHVAALRRYGIEASAPMFVPGLGAFVRMKQYPTDAHEEARTGLAGPLWGLGAAALAAAIGYIFSLPVALAVASLGGSINLFNLVPVWQLDGSRGLRALSRNQRLLVAATGLFTAIATHQWMPGIVGVATLARSFASDAHDEGDKRMLALFVVLIVAHSLFGTLPLGAASFAR